MYAFRTHTIIMHRILLYISLTGSQDSPRINLRLLGGLAQAKQSAALAAKQTATLDKIADSLPSKEDARKQAKRARQDTSINQLLVSVPKSIPFAE